MDVKGGTDGMSGATDNGASTPSLFCLAMASLGLPRDLVEVYRSQSVPQPSLTCRCLAEPATRILEGLDRLSFVAANV